jgi:hypothetical protein
VLPIVMALDVMRNAGQHTANDALAALLIQDIACGQPILLPQSAIERLVIADKGRKRLPPAENAA